MTTETDDEKRLTEILTAVNGLAKQARQRTVQIEDYFQQRAASAGLLEALVTVHGSVMRELAENEIYRELQGEIAKAAEMAGDAELEPRQEFAVIRRFVEKLGKAARRRVEADSSSFMHSRRALERHNAVLRVLEDLEERIDEGRPLAR